MVFENEAPIPAGGGIGPGSPVPRSLVWAGFVQDIIVRVGTMPAAGLILLGISLFGVLGYALLRLLNPTFRLTTGVDWDGTILTHTYMHTPPVIKAFLIGIAAFVPLFAIWAVIPAGLPWTAWMRCPIVGMAIWLLFSRDGVAGDFDSGNYEIPRERARLNSLIVRGALAGFSAAAIVHVASTFDGRKLFDFYQALGAFGQGQWMSIVGLVCGGAAALGFAAGGLAVALSASSRRSTERLRGAALPLLALAGAWFLFGRWLPGHMRERYDYPQPNFAQASRALAGKANVGIDDPGIDTIILMRPQRSIALNVRRQSVTGIAATAESAKRVDGFLARRDYATALADPAFKTLHDTASLRWNSLESLRVDYTNLTRSPQSPYMGLFIQKLRTSAATAETRHYADLLADESRFAFPDREALVEMGDVYATLGERAKAERWYRRAQVPESRLAELLTERTMFCEGRVSGRILLNGRPAKGFRIGLVPDPTIREAFRTSFPPGVIRPFWLRWVGPTTNTDESGRFDVTDIVAGHYRMIVSSPDLKLPAFSPRLSVTNAPGEMFVAYGKKHFPLGDIGIVIGYR